MNALNNTARFHTASHLCASNVIRLEAERLPQIFGYSFSQV